MTDITAVPQYIQMTDQLTGYGHNLHSSGHILLTELLYHETYTGVTAHDQISGIW